MEDTPEHTPKLLPEGRGGGIHVPTSSQGFLQTEIRRGD